MISKSLLTAFVNASTALAKGIKDTGFTSNGLRKLDFQAADENGKQRTYTALEQNTNKLSVPAKLARQGHTIIQIRDDDQNVLLGNVDVEEKRFNSYENIPTVVSMDDINAALGNDAVRNADEIQVSATRTAVPPADTGKKAA